MKKLILFVAWLMLCCAAAAQSTLTGTVKLPDGTGFTGRLIFALAQNASVSTVSPCTGPTLVVPTDQVTVLVSSGVLQSPPTMVSSVCTIPIGVPYDVTAIDSNGNIVFTDQWLINGTSFDVGTAVSSETSPVVNYKGLWSSTTSYLPGDIVAYGGATPNLYYSLLGNNLNNNPSSVATYWKEISGGGGGGGGSPPYAPAYSVQIANADATSFLSDPNITVDTTTHTMEFGGAVTGNSFTLDNLSAVPASWTLDVTSPVTAVNSLAPGLAAPPPIGSTTPNTGKFSTLTVTGAASVSGTNCLQIDSTGLISNTGSACGAGGGGVSSVALTMDGVIFNSTVSGSPITTSGTFAPSLKSQSAGLFLAGPASGVAAAPTFRAIVNTDLTSALASPPAIGGTSPAAGAFTSVTDSGAAPVSGTDCLQISSTGLISNSGSACGSGSATPSAPAYSVQVANAGVTGLTSDSNVTVDTTNHALDVGGTISGNAVNIVNLSPIPASWTLDMTSPVTALNSLATGLASPPAIGGTTPAAGSFSSLRIGTDNAITAGPRATLTSGSIGAITAGAQYSPAVLVEPGTIENVVASASSFTCSVNPTITIEDCGSSTGCVSPTALASVTLTAANTWSTGTVSSATLTAGHTVVWEMTAGTCSALSISASAEYRMN